MLFSLAALQGAAPPPHPLNGTIADWIWLVPLLPLIGFVINGWLSFSTVAKVGPRDPSAGGHGAHDGHAAQDDHGADHDPAHAARHRFAGIVSLVGPAVLVIAFGLAAAIFWTMGGTGMEEPLIRRLFSWMVAGDLTIDAALQLDALSMTMVLVITGVGALIHLFSVGYMQDDPGYPRYFAYLNLFVFFMLLLVLGASYPVLFVGWEGVGLCSYLLIGFWFSDQANADAGKKAFIVNRIGDFGFLVAMFLIFANFGTLDFTSLQTAVQGIPYGEPLVTTICLFLFLGCAGKSAQIPLYIWLPDAMAGPTPVSALIHAATMVTAGVYLIARSGFLFSIAPAAQLVVAIVGALTALFAATIGLKQWDIKKVLAYSTVSQLGYMFVGVGVGAYTAGMFHLVTHAFFKALLFLGSGSVIFAMHRAYHATHNHDDAQDMRNMGGLRKHMPVTCALMWIATFAIAGIPPFAGFFSKDEILGSVFTRATSSSIATSHLLGIPGSTWLYVIYGMGLTAALLTATYMTRMMLYTFHGPNRTGEPERAHLREAPWIMTGPLVVLAALSLAGGWLNLPEITRFLGPTERFAHWLEPVVRGPTELVTQGHEHLDHSVELVLILLAVALAIAGMLIAVRHLRPARVTVKAQMPESLGIARVLENKYYVDEAYDRVIVEPTLQVSRNVLWRGIDTGLIDGLFVNGSAWFARGFGWIGSQLQSGQISTYAWVLILGVVAVIGAFTLR